MLIVAALVASMLSVAPSSGGWASAGAASHVRRDPSARLFDPAVLHEVAFTVAAPDLAALTPGAQDRVPAAMTVDGVERKNVGVRLLGGASARPLDQKAGFSVKTDEFVDGRSVAGVQRFSLANALRDPSFVGEHVTYEVFRRAGIPAPRTALANVTVNGEPFGLYVLREGYDQDFLARNFDDPDGNLYEAPAGADLSDPALEPRTNENSNNKADISALKRVVDATPDDAYANAVGTLVDLPKLYSYWAAEALTAHWGGYVAPTNVPFANTDPTIVMGNPEPDSYYAYHDPTTGKFVVLPSGADQSLGAGIGPGAAQTPAFTAPKTGARTAARLAPLPGTGDALRARMRRVIDRAWDPAVLLARADQAAALVRANGLKAPREEWTMEDFEAAFAARRAFVAERADAVRSELGAPLP